MNYSLIANTGIHFFTFELELNNQFKMWFHEYTSPNNKLTLTLLHKLKVEDEVAFFNRLELYTNGYIDVKGSLRDNIVPTWDMLRKDRIDPIDEENDEGKKAIFEMGFNRPNSKLNYFENVWLPLPYFCHKIGTSYEYNALNWARMKLIPVSSDDSTKRYTVVLAFDTRTANPEDNQQLECPCFVNNKTSLDFDLCQNEKILLDYCSGDAQKQVEYIDKYLFKLVNPNLNELSQVRTNDGQMKMAYMATYIYLIDYLAQYEKLPKIKLYKDTEVADQGIDLIVDIGNSKTTAIVSDGSEFKNDYPLQMLDYTNMVIKSKDALKLNVYEEPFDMRLAFRKINLGNFGIRGSKQFVVPSFVRLGQEAQDLIHRAKCQETNNEKYSTYSSPKRYLWDNGTSKKEWEYLLLDGENDNTSLEIVGISEYLKDDGSYDREGNSGIRHKYSRCSLMTFAFLEIISQATRQINSFEFRNHVGREEVPHRIQRIIVTCPTTMSKEERKALIDCARTATLLLAKFNNQARTDIEIVPSPVSYRDDEDIWYYDEATCSQLVYMYGEIGYKYRGACHAFFDCYGKNTNGQSTLTVGSIDIGAGTTDLMINEYVYQQNEVTMITPRPTFFDSYYSAGDDMLKELVKKIMLLDDEHSAFYKQLSSMSTRDYLQLMRDIFGDRNGMSFADKQLRHELVIQYCVPLMNYYLSLLVNESKNRIVTFDEVFTKNKPSNKVIEGFKAKTDINITTLNWYFDYQFTSQVVNDAFEPLLKKVAIIMYAQSCDIILLSGRPSSIPIVRQLLLKYYPVAPNRLITLTNYYVGDWYPFDRYSGFISNPKTVVAVGAVVGYYASENAALDMFHVDLTELKNRLKSQVNYISAPRQTEEYIIEPEKSRGEFLLYELPACLKTRQIKKETYPARNLYKIDFDENEMFFQKRGAKLRQGQNPTEASIWAEVNTELQNLRSNAPYAIEIQRDAQDKEKIEIVSATDKNGNDISPKIKLHVQSLDSNEYWLDSGIIEL